MAEISWPWPDNATGDGRKYSDDEWSDMWNEMHAQDRTLQGVVAGVGGELAVTGVTSPVSVAAGRALVDGKFYKSDAVVTVVVPTPSASTSRIDLIVLRKGWSGQTVRIARVAGTEAGSPTPPALTQTDGTTWEIELARATILDTGAITVVDRRNFVGSPIAMLFTGPGRELTIATGAITLRGEAFYRVDTEADAATDDLDTISGGKNGQVVVLRAENAARTVQVRSGIGNILLAGQEHLPLVALDQLLMLRFDGTNWVEITGGAERLVPVGAVLGDGTSTIPSGSYVDIPFLPHLYVMGYYVMADASGSVNLDVRAAVFPTIPVTTIVGSDAPSLSAQQTKSSTALTGWTREHAKQTAMRFIATNAATTIKQLSIVLLCVKLG